MAKRMNVATALRAMVVIGAMAGALVAADVVVILVIWFSPKLRE